MSHNGRVQTVYRLIVRDVNLLSPDFEGPADSDWEPYLADGSTREIQVVSLQLSKSLIETRFFIQTTTEKRPI